MKQILSILFLILFSATQAQDPDRFKDELVEIDERYNSVWDSSKETVVFTGSSSVRMWHNLQELFPEYQIVNTGFGGSHASDLLFHLNPLVLKYSPKKVFIYEGDNDLSAKKKVKDIIATTKEIIAQIKSANQSTQIVLISAKPSIARWNLKGKYKRLNRKMSKLAAKDANVEYSGIWKTMLAKRKLKKEIFIKDGLHMNAKGYDLWYDVIKNYMN
ncbi:MAG: G-D-S-L family lipolytic protein [Flavobacteriaceae bacterium]|nr:MAG: G-D-S-L family lipolytic protein [Flavobacteriaceae bacterium]